MVLRHVVDQHAQPTVDAAMVEIETEAADLERLAAAFVLPGVDARVQQMEDLVVAREKRLTENLGVAEINRRGQRCRRDDDALVDRAQQFREGLLFLLCRPFLLRRRRSGRLLRAEWQSSRKKEEKCGEETASHGVAPL
jgi:hypothetical protein